MTPRKPVAGTTADERAVPRSPAGAEIRRALSRLEPDDPLRPLVELVADDRDPRLVTAVVGRILAEIRTERGGSRTARSSVAEEIERGTSRPPR